MLITKQIIFLILLFLSQVILAQKEGLQTQLSEQCLEGLQEQAQTAGLSSSLINEIIPNLKYLPKVIKYDRSQPEFTQTFETYLNKRVTAKRIKEGKFLFKKHHDYLELLVRKYGVPGRYLIAFWGLETNFGNYPGNMSTLNSLATLACDDRRPEFFTKELLLALKLIDRESLKPDKMTGSWAGAMGHTQFMPSTYYQYSVDGDGDGQINLWSSVRDALASSANYLQQLGWESGKRWGREVHLPADFPYAMTGYKNWKTLKEWKTSGVTTIYGKSLPDVDIQAAILLPSGHSGPAFLVYQNFDIIMHWNRSQFYALSVGLLADRITGMGPLSKPPVNEKRLGVETVLTLQQSLTKSGFDTGKPDGIMGSKTRQAIQAFQASVGLIADGYPDHLTIEKLVK